MESQKVVTSTRFALPICVSGIFPTRRSLWPVFNILLESGRWGLNANTVPLYKEATFIPRPQLCVLFGILAAVPEHSARIPCRDLVSYPLEFTQLILE